MGRFTTILWDLDQTILDFDKSMDYALRASFKHLGLTITDEIVERYASINDSYWKRLELGEVTKNGVLTGRFRTLFEELKISQYQPADIADYYQELHKNAVSMIKSLVEPVIICLLAVAVGFIMLSIIIPMFDLYQQM